jgi:hypothetical protein
MLAFSDDGGGYADVAKFEYDGTGSPWPFKLTLHNRPFGIVGGSTGIGTANPNSLLDATGPADDSEANFKTSSTYFQLVLHDSDTSTAGLKIGYRFQNGVAEYGRIQAYDSANGTQLAINPNGGNVGIGVTNPARKLHIKDANKQVAQLESTAVSNLKIDICVNNGSPNGIITALRGSLCVDVLNAILYINRSGTLPGDTGTTWSAV